MKLTVKKSLLYIGLVCAATHAYAATPGFYIGGSLGLSDVTDQNNFFSDNYSTGNLTGTPISQTKDEGGIGGGLAIGYNINKYVGAEIGYQLNSSNYYSATVGSMSGTTKLESHSFNFLGKAYLPFDHDKWNLFAEAGIAYARAFAQTSGAYGRLNSSNGTEKQYNWLPMFGAGFGYNVGKHVMFDATYTRVQAISSTHFVGNNLSLAVPSSNLFALGATYFIG